MQNKEALLKAIDQLVASKSEYKIRYPQFVNWSVTRALQAADVAAAYELISFGLGTAAGAIGIVKTVIDNFISLINALRISEHYLELIGAAEAAVAWTFGDATKPRIGEQRKKALGQHYTGQRLEVEWRGLKTAWDGSVNKTWQQLDSMSVRWVQHQWRQATQTGGGAPGAHMRVSRRPVLASPLPTPQQRRTPPGKPKDVFRFLLLMALQNDRRAFEKRLLQAAAKGMSAQDRLAFEVHSGLKFM
jgi:hypothetical protein